MNYCMVRLEAQLTIRELAAHLPDDSPVVLGTKDRRAGDQGVSACARYLGDVVGLHTAVDFEPDRLARSVDARAHRTQLIECAGNKFLPAESRIHRHDQYQIELVEHIIEIIERCRRIESEACLAAVFLDQSDGAVDVLGSLTIER